MNQKQNYWQVWLGLLPPLYFLSPLSLLALPALTKFHRSVQVLFLFFLLTQLLPACFTPEPLLTIPLALARVALMVALMCVGAHLAQSRSDRQSSIPTLPWLGLGLTTVCLTALVISAWQGRDLLTLRLHHPYMTSVTLGVLAAIGVWWSAFNPGHWAMRLMVGLLALPTLLLSGSRGALLAVVAGLAAGFLIRRWRARTVIVLGGVTLVVTGLVAYGLQRQVNAFERLMQLDVTGRQVIWHNVLTVIQSEPFNGVGPYRLGSYLASPSLCQTFADATQNNQCPAWFDQLGQPWLIAHNITMQQWSESGPTGTLGLFLLLGCVLAASLRHRQPFAVAVVMGLLLTNLTDNTLLVPGPFMGELFWVIAGTQLRHFSLLAPRSVLTVSGSSFFLLSLLSSPVLLATRSPLQPTRPELLAFYAPARAQGSPYQFFASVKLPPGTYLASLSSCNVSCRTVQTRSVRSDGQDPAILDWNELVLPAGRQQLSLLIFPTSGTRLNAIAVHRWTPAP